jgi:CRP-like cAMP-binding protein
MINLVENELSKSGLPPLIRKLNFMQSLTVNEIAFLMKMHEKIISIDERKIILDQGDAHTKSFIVIEGWAYRYNDLSNGNRQIINYYLPGDIISPFALVMPKTPYSVASLTSLKLSVFKPEMLVQLFSTQPKLGLLYGWILGREDSIVAEQVVRIGRRSAYIRTAHLLLEFFHRLKIIGETENKTFSLPITQHLLADTLGLSLVHMNRTLKKLSIDKLIKISSNEISLLDFDKIKQITEFESSYLEQIKKLTIIPDDAIDKLQLNPPTAA